MYRPYWNSYQCMSSENRGALRLSHKGQLVLNGILLGVYAVSVVVALRVIS